MGYGFNKDSQFETWGNLSDYSSKEQLDELEIAIALREE